MGKEDRQKSSSVRRSSRLCSNIAKKRRRQDNHKRPQARDAVKQRKRRVRQQPPKAAEVRKAHQRPPSVRTSSRLAMQQKINISETMVVQDKQKENSPVVAAAKKMIRSARLQPPQGVRNLHD